MAVQTLSRPSLGYGSSPEKLIVDLGVRSEELKDAPKQRTARHLGRIGSGSAREDGQGILLNGQPVNEQALADRYFGDGLFAFEDDLNFEDEILDLIDPAAAEGDEEPVAEPMWHENSYDRRHSGGTRKGYRGKTHAKTQK